MLSEDDPRPAAEQFQTNYPFGGWHPFEGFKLSGTTLKYPGDPPLMPIAETALRDERIFLYQSAWVMILQPDGTFSVSRLD